VQRPSGKVESITVKIPPGVADGGRIRLRGQGEPSPTGGAAGDLLIKIRVAPHRWFRRNGDNLEVDVPITIGEAALGAKIEVPTPKGAIKLTVPPCSSGGRRLRVKGHGVPRKNGADGDLYAVLRIVLPDQLDEQSEAALRELSERQRVNPRADLRW
jgi:DnaJ-class molecular chaperone